MAQLRRVAPILPVRDLQRALSHYEQMGFETRVYERGGYGFASEMGSRFTLVS
jgi:hypothetical protein